MPLFDLECQKCGSVHEHLVRTGDAPTCPDCDSPSLRKLVSKPAAQRPKGGSHLYGNPGDKRAPIRNDGGPRDAIGNQAAAARARGSFTCC